MDLKLLCFSFLMLLILPSSDATTDTSRPCTDQSDCHADECCVSRTPPRGRRLVSAPGHCVRLGRLGSDCYVSLGSAAHPPSGLVYGCPCALGYLCLSSGVQEIPLGYRGTCHIII